MIDTRQVMYDIERCISHVPDACRDCSHYKHGEYLDCMEELLKDALAMLKERGNEYENGFNDAMLGKQELMYEGTDGKWHKKDW